jgi:hypothetical protein
VTEQQTNIRTAEPENRADVCISCGVNAIHFNCLSLRGSVYLAATGKWLCPDCETINFNERVNLYVRFETVRVAQA